MYLINSQQMTEIIQYLESQPYKIANPLINYLRGLPKMENSTPLEDVASPVDDAMKPEENVEDEPTT